ncbi:four-carbon acid sugar kinase family protein [Rhizobium sp. YIM 134829]|uniref:four-carbon acid sugar kinase family protein n=1 Tax=Rhizobium sp. YIM 134829 TaxID=3390453 RepID=UPI00397E2A01
MLVILADDLTGTLDAAAPFAGRGLVTEVVLSPAALDEALAARPDVLSINLRSREIGGAAAKAATETLIARLPSDVTLFKKVDSRLKGWIAEELEATPFTKALVAPAIPEFGRIVREGAVRGFGVAEPLPIAAVLGTHAQRALIPETESAADLSEALEAGFAAGVDLLIGARGLGEALALHMTDGRPARPVPVPPGRGLFVIGSRDPITLAQIEQLTQNHALQHLPAPNGVLNAQSRATDELVLVQAVAGETTISSVKVSEHLATSVHPRLTEHAETVLLSGGATAEAVLEAMGIARFRLIGECLPGLGIAEAGPHRIIAKSGGFGGPDTLSRIAAALKEGIV